MASHLIVAAVLLSGCAANDDIPTPMIAAVTPARAPVSTIVVVTGDYFCQRPHNTGQEDPTCPVAGTVRFGAVPGTPSVYTETQIMVEVPLGVSGRADVSITAAGRTSNSVVFVAE